MGNWWEKSALQMTFLVVLLLFIAVLAGFWFGNVYRLAIDREVLEEISDINVCFP
jgi:hypothetical protein